jgi:hypothetical protein
MTNLKKFLSLAVYTAGVISFTLYLAQLNKVSEDDAYSYLMNNTNFKQRITDDIRQEVFEFIKNDVKDIRSIPLTNSQKLDILLNLINQNRQRLSTLESQSGLKAIKL